MQTIGELIRNVGGFLTGPENRLMTLFKMASYNRFKTSGLKFLAFKSVISHHSFVRHGVQPATVLQRIILVLGNIRRSLSYHALTGAAYIIMQLRLARILQSRPTCKLDCQRTSSGVAS
jgi:hypothetical protein